MDEEEEQPDGEENDADEREEPEEEEEAPEDKGAAIPRTAREPESEHLSPHIVASSDGGWYAPGTRRSDAFDDLPVAIRRRLGTPTPPGPPPGESRADRGASLTDHWRRNGRTGPGADLMECRSSSTDAEALICFYAMRALGTRRKPYKRSKTSKNLRFDTADVATGVP